MMKGYDWLTRLSRDLSGRYLPTVMVDLFAAAQENNRYQKIPSGEGVGNRGEKGYRPRRHAAGQKDLENICTHG
jgi:hypothetical protein